MATNSLPSAGGVLDQNWILMRQFSILRRVQIEKEEFEQEIERQRQESPYAR